MIHDFTHYFLIGIHSQIRECLKLDPEHKECFPHYKKVKKVAKVISDMNAAAEAKDYQTCISAAKKVFLSNSNLLVGNTKRNANLVPTQQFNGDHL